MLSNIRASKRSPSPVGFNFSTSGTGGTNSMQGAHYPGVEKETMRGLNERLKDYMAEVKLLEEANNKLEEQIKQALTEKRAAGDRDWSGYHNMLSTLRGQVREITMENTGLMLQIDNTRLVADDLRIKLETEVAVRQGVEQDVGNLRKMIDDTTITRMQLEGQIESLMDELNFLAKTHEEDVANLQNQIRASNVEVQMEATRGQDLTETIDKIRQQYERTAQKNQEDTEAWFQAKLDSISVEVTKSCDELQQGKSELNDLHRQKQVLEIELQTLHTMNHSLEDTLKDKAGSYAREMSKRNTVIQELEAELADVHAQVKRHGAEYQALLNVKSKLEEEIATYHQLLDGTGSNEPNNLGVRQNGYNKGSGVREDANGKNIGLPEDANGKNIGLPEDANIMDFDLPDDANPEDTDLPGHYDESVEFSLHQALDAAPPCLVPTTSLTMNKKTDEEMVAQKEQELNAANIALSEKEDLDESAGQEADESQEAIQEEQPVVIIPVQHTGLKREINRPVEDMGNENDEPNTQTAVEGKGETEKRCLVEDRDEDEEVKSSVEDVEVKSSVEDAEVKSSVEDVEVKSSVEDVEVKSSVEDVEVKSSVEDAEVKSSVEDAEVKSSVEDAEVKSSLADEELKNSTEDSKGEEEGETDSEVWREANEEINSMADGSEADDEEFSSITDGRAADEEECVECIGTDEEDEDRSTPVEGMEQKEREEKQEKVAQEGGDLKMTEV